MHIHIYIYIYRHIYIYIYSLYIYIYIYMHILTILERSNFSGARVLRRYGVNTGAHIYFDLEYSFVVRSRICKQSGRGMLLLILAFTRITIVTANILFAIMSGTLTIVSKIVILVSIHTVSTTTLTVLGFGETGMGSLRLPGFQGFGF